MDRLPALFESSIRYCILFSRGNRSRDTTTGPGLWRDAAHGRKQRMVEEAKCVAAMQTVKVCVLQVGAVFALSAVPGAGAARFCSGWKQ